MTTALAQGLLTELNLAYPAVDLGGLYVLFNVDKQLPAKVRVMIDYLVEKLT